MATALDDRVAIPLTERLPWPGSREAGPVAHGAEVHLTAWLRPRAGGELDGARAIALGMTPPSQRTYADRDALARETDADPADVELLRTYCRDSGLRVVATHWRSVVIAGPVEALVRAFGATVAIHEDAAGRRFRHRSDALHVPAALVPVLRGVFGLHQWPRSRRLGALARHSEPLRASDVAARYRFPDADADGRGQTIGVVQLDGTFAPADFAACMAAQGISRPLPARKSVDDTGVAHEHATAKDLEAALDVQIVGALAPGATIVSYEAPDTERGFLDAIRVALFDDDHPLSVLSISYGWPEPLWTPAALHVLEDLFALAALTGVSVFCSSGDNGGELDDDGKPHVVAPASSPFALACGATTIADPGDASEAAWDKTGGGFSERFDVPAWQDVARASATQYGATAGRGVPDVAAQQHPGYYVIVNGVELAMGGTSAVAPVMAALTARIGQRLGVRTGFFAPLLYARRRDGLFGAVLDGGNGTYEAGADWNPCTGLGVPNGVAIEAALRATS